MKIGMLWFDNDPKSEISAKVGRAADYYRTKYGASPNVCFVHPSMLVTANPPEEGKVVRAGSVELRASRSVLPNHFWIGVNGGDKLVE
jgi:hypothetical protein